jgi:hypothetical protein
MCHRNRFLYAVPWLLLGLQLGPAGTVMRAAQLPASHEAAAQQLISNLQLHERFLELQESYLEFIRGKGTPPALVADIGEQLKLTNVMERIGGFVAAQFSEAELTPINAYLETDAGKKEYQLMLALVKERRNAPPGSVDVSARMTAFKASLTAKDREAVDAFRGSTAGQKYSAQLGAIDRKLTEIFNQRRDEILQKLAANAGKAK